MKRRQFALIPLWMCMLLVLISTYCWATENPPTVTITTPSTYPSGQPDLYSTSKSSIDLGGMAGVVITGTAVNNVDLSHWPSPVPEEIRVNITRAAEQAVIYTKNFGSLGCVLASGTFYLNGAAINYLIGDSINDLIHAINQHTSQTGVYAYEYGFCTIGLTTLSYGSSAAVTITNGADILPDGIQCASDCGVDGGIQVTNSANESITDPLWESSDGFSFYDSLGNEIELNERAVSVTNLGPQIMTDQQIDHVTWFNSATGGSGVCSGTQAWSISGMSLTPGDNPITITATDTAGLSGTGSILIKSNLGRNFQITSPTSLPTYSTTNATLDIGGQIAPYAVIVGPAVISSDLSHLPLSVQVGNYIDIQIVQAAGKAKTVSKCFGTGDDACIGATGAFILAGSGNICTIEYTPAMTVIQLRDEINSHTAETGIVATTDGSGMIVFTSKYYGSSACMSITNGRDILPGGYNSTAVIGADAHAVVTDSTGTNISDADWTSGSGLVLGDSLGNTIELTQQAAESPCGVFSNHLWLTADEVGWSNERTGESGICMRSTEWTAGGVILLPGENNIHVSSTSPDGTESMDDLLVTYYEPKKVGAAKQMDNGSYVSLSSMVVTAGNADTGDVSTIYVEQANKACGVKVIGASADRGDVLDIEGIMTASDGERAVDVSTGSVEHSWNPDLSEPCILAPVGMANKAIGGGANGLQCGVMDIKGNPIYGLNNVGLLVRTWGKVKSTDPAAHKFTIDDGSGVCVTCLAPLSIDLPDEESKVIATGISSIDWMPVDPEGDPAIASPVQLIKARDGEDIKPY